MKKGTYTELRGGKRAGAGRKKSDVPTIRCSVRITEEQESLLKEWGGGNTSAGLRWLIDTATHLIVKK